MNELQSVQSSLEDAGQKLIEKASTIQHKMTQLESKHLQMKQTSRDIHSSTDVTQLEEAKNVAAIVHEKLGEIRKMIGIYNEAHKKK